MRNLHRQAQPGRETTEHDDDVASKSKRKAEMQALQDLGERLIDLPADRLKRVPLPDHLREAIRDARRFTQHEAIRRQRQYVGKLMRDADDETLAGINAAIAAFDGDSAEDKARLHKLEKLRDRIVDDESALTEFTRRHPQADVQRLRQLRRNGLKERQDNKPPKSFRLLYQEIKALEFPGSAGRIHESGIADEFLQADGGVQDE